MRKVNPSFVLLCYIKGKDHLTYIDFFIISTAVQDAGGTVIRPVFRVGSLDFKSQYRKDMLEIQRLT